jgi:hypothetical protein
LKVKNRDTDEHRCSQIKNIISKIKCLNKKSLDLADVIDKAELYLMPGGHQARSM